MANSISAYSKTAASNTDLGGINTTEGEMVPGDISNSVRELMSHLAEMNDGTAALTSPQLTSVDINGGTVDGADVTVGSGKTLDVSGGTITLANDQISGDKIDGGTITSTFTGNLTGNVTGNASGTAATVTTAAQPNITSVGTLTSFRSTGIDDNADALAITIDSDENVGIGTSHFGLFTAVAGSAKMAVVGDSNGTNVIGNTDAALAIVNKDGTASNTAGLHFARADTDETPNYASASIVCQFGATQVTGQYSAGSLHFSVSGWQNGAPSLKMTIASDGVISGDLNDTSDRNLKENISSISTSIDVVKALNPVMFDWTAEEKGTNRAGFIAQDVEEILPNEVSGAEFDPEDEDNPTIGKSINVTGIVAHLTRALQESMAQIEAQEARIAALEGA